MQTDYREKNKNDYNDWQISEVIKVKFILITFAN
jgi:hypothetical protein